MINLYKLKCFFLLKFSFRFFSKKPDNSENFVARSKIKESLEDKKNVLYKQIKASGPGGQHVNKTNSAVFLKDLSTNTTVKVSDSRYSEVNNYKAKKRLLDKVDLKLNGKESKIGQKIEKSKKQKNRNYRRSVEKHQNTKK